ncbi:Two-component response regulator GltR [Candidatus Terasakiella magnetica]|uniref:Regulatory protein VirG n=1 Tax=Candidatus Terasakiella magnetica TaxID=1867952 RepID=A0A1C3RJH8_9PROT|nr:response regulator transcription factor [Candidatus Terasakiella magnetica]SCA57440.1 Two-component response regulator GltR [Candidatus Terasakiella magnetica]
MNDVRHILIVEDDPAVADVVAACLEDAEFATTITSSGQAALNIIADTPVDLCVVDLGLPDMDGLSLTREIKSRSAAGIIILSGRGETTERIIGLEVGADDYLGKPFEPRELLARVRSIIRRTQPCVPNDVSAPNIETDRSDMFFVFEGWKVDLSSLEITGPNGLHPQLSNSEFNLLQAFIEHPNRILSRDQLLDLVHGDNTPAFDRSIDVQITRLRKKIESDPKTPKFIKTVRNRGYMFTAKVTRN